MKWLLKFGLGIAAVCSSSLLLAGTVTVTSPSKGTVTAPTPVKASTAINFNIVSTPAVASEVTIDVKVFRLDTGALYRNLPAIVKVTPNTEGKVSGSFNLTFTQGIDPEVTYRVEVRAKEVDRPGEVYNTNQNLFLRPDLTAPKILQFSPLVGAAVKGTVLITVQIQETNLKDWRVQVDGGVLPNGEGTTVDAEGRFTVSWDTSGIQFDGPKTINIRVRDDADNETNQNINVTIDRVKPIVTIQSPLNNAQFAPGTTLSVVVDIRDLNIVVTGVDVVLRKTDGAFITRVARQSFQSIGNNTFRWVGRVRWREGFLPPTFKVHGSAIDRAGNAATTQSVTVRIGS